METCLLSVTLSLSILDTKRFVSREALVPVCLPFVFLDLRLVSSVSLDLSVSSEVISFPIFSVLSQTMIETASLSCRTLTFGDPLSAV